MSFNPSENLYLLANIYTSNGWFSKSMHAQGTGMAEFIADMINKIAREMYEAEHGIIPGSALTSDEKQKFEENCVFTSNRCGGERGILNQKGSSVLLPKKKHTTSLANSSEYGVFLGGERGIRTLVRVLA